MLNLVKPRYVMPFHGDFKRLRLHAQLAEAVGVPPEDIFQGDNGLPLDIDARGARFGAREQAGMIFVDGVEIGDMADVALRDRRMLSADGIFIVVVTIAEQDGSSVADPEVIFRGVPFQDEADELLEEIRVTVEGSLERRREGGNPRGRPAAADAARRPGEASLRPSQAAADGAARRRRGLAAPAGARRSVRPAWPSRARPRSARRRRRARWRRPARSRGRGRTSRRGRRRRGRSARTGSRRAPRGRRGRRPRRPARRARRAWCEWRPGSRCPGGVWRSAFSSRLIARRCSSSRAPSTTAGWTSSVISCVGADRAELAGGLDDDLREVARLARLHARGVGAGEQQQVARRAGACAARSAAPSWPPRPGRRCRDSASSSRLASTLVSGVRSSCEASATKRRWRASIASVSPRAASSSRSIPSSVRASSATSSSAS